jgi:uncharacterized Zn finger protein (UPF0148 family)
MIDLKKAQSLCQEWILTGFPGAHVLATGTRHFAAESATGELCLYEIRIPGSSSPWPAKLFEQKKLKDAMIRATLRNKSILYAVVQVFDVENLGLRFRFDQHTSKLHWGQVYQDEPVPELEIVQKKSEIPKADKNNLVVTHKMKGFGLTQVHTYVLPVAHLSQKLCSSILEHANYPSVVPHSHTIVDGEILIYDRNIHQWEDHSATRDAYTGSVKKFECVTCRTPFFGFAGEVRCRTCQSVIGASIIKAKKGLVEKAAALAESTDWKVTGEAMRDMMDLWKVTGHAGDQEDGLWDKFQAARQPFFDARAAFFEVKQVSQGGSLEAKKKLIEEAKKLSSSSDWKGTSALMRDLMDKWRSAGNAGREHEDALWKEFQAARQVFYDRQSQFFGR